MLLIAGIFSLLTAAAGWFYLFYSKAAERLAGVEDTKTNRLRVRGRRVGGCSMILLAICFYVGCDALLRPSPILFVLMMSAVFIFMMLVLIMGLYDVRLTRKLRRGEEQRRRKELKQDGQR